MFNLFEKTVLFLFNITSFVDDIQEPERYVIEISKSALENYKQDEKPYNEFMDLIQSK